MFDRQCVLSNALMSYICPDSKSNNGDGDTSNVQHGASFQCISLLTGDEKKFPNWTMLWFLKMITWKQILKAKVFTTPFHFAHFDRAFVECERSMPSAPKDGSADSSVEERKGRRSEGRGKRNFECQNSNCRGWNAKCRKSPRADA